MDKSNAGNSIPATPLVRIYPPSEQGKGSFDGGKITEIKPIGFPGEGSAASRIGPLFYWAWASSTESATIALHPHKGFEIVSYVLRGEVGHSDTGGNTSRIGPGGAQLMQTGSGISHEERVSDAAELFQIWFEPNLREALARPPEYHEATDAQLPEVESAGVRVKSILGGQSPLSLVADAQMDQLTFEPNTSYAIGGQAGKTQAMVVVEGDFQVKVADESKAAQARDFVVVKAGPSGVTIKAGTTSGGKIVVVSVPSDVPYALLKE